MNTRVDTQRRRSPVRTSRATIATAVVALSLCPAVASAHDAGATTQGDVAVPFGAAIGLSTLGSVAIGLAIVRRYRSRTVGHGPTGDWMTAILLFLGLLAALSAVGQQVSVAIVGVTVGGAIAWLGRARGVSPHDGCADAAFGAILLHRTVEGVLIAGVYAASAVLGAVGLLLLTGHAIGETVAIAGLYAPLGRGWGIAGVLGIHLGFLAGAVVGRHLLGVLSPSIVTALLAVVGGVLLVTGVTERRAATKRRRQRLDGAVHYSSR